MGANITDDWVPPLMTFGPGSAPEGLIVENVIGSDGAGGLGSSGGSSSLLESMPSVSSDYTPHYTPNAPFSLDFDIDDQGNTTKVQMKNPVFLWADGSSVSLKTAQVSGLSTSGTIWLNIQTGNDDKYASSSVSNSSSGTISVPLYDLSNKGVVVDYRHALITLGTCTVSLSGNGTVVTGMDYGTFVPPGESTATKALMFYRSNLVVRSEESGYVVTVEDDINITKPLTQYVAVVPFSSYLSRLASLAQNGSLSINGAGSDRSPLSNEFDALMSEPRL